MNLQTFTTELRRLVAEGKPEEAIQKLLHVYRQIRGKYHDEVIVISSRFSDIQEEQMAGIIDPDDAQRKINQVNHSLLQVIQNLGNDPAIASHFGEKINSGGGSEKKGGLGKYLPWILTAILLLALAIFVLPKFFGGEKTAGNPTEEVAENDRGNSTENNESATPDRPGEKQKDAPPAKPKKKNTATITDEEKEPNETLFEANQIKYNSVTKGNIATRKDRDSYVFTTSSGYRNVYDVLIKNLSTDLSPALWIYDENRKQLHRESESTQGADLKFEFRTLPNSTYYIQCGHYGSWDGSGPYELVLTLEEHETDGPSETEPNETAFEATPFDWEKGMNGFVTDNNDRDFFKFTAPRSGKATAKISNRSPRLSPGITIYNGSRKKIKDGSESTRGADYSLVVNLEAGEVYYVKVNHYGSWQGHGDYVLSFSFEE